jgi:hypothetical protein
MSNEEDEIHEAYGAMVHRGMRERDAGVSSAAPIGSEAGAVADDRYAAGFLAGQEEVLGRATHANGARLSLHNAIATELGVPAGTEALWKATDWVLMRLWSEGYKIVAFDPEPFGMENDDGC